MAARLLATLLVVSTATLGCASFRPSPVACAIAGQIAGVAGGVAVGNSADDGGETAGKIVGGVLGFAVGAAAGYYLCKALQEESPAPPPEAEAESAPPAPPPPVEQERIVLRGVQFGFDKAEIEPAEAVVIDEAAALLERRKDVKVRIEGHTDSTGPSAYNEALSERRAEAVRDHLLGRGVAADRLTTQGFGEANPIADNGTREGRALNRRVQLQTLE